MPKKRGKEEPIVPRLLTSQVLDNILDVHTKYHIHTTRQMQFIAAIVGIILSITITQLFSTRFSAFNKLTQLGIVTILASSLFSVLLCLQAEEPGKIKKSRHLHALEYEEVTDESSKAYKIDLKKLLANNDDIIEEYAIEIAHIKHLLAKKYNRLRTVTQTLLLGLLVGASFIVISIIRSKLI